MQKIDSVMTKPGMHHTFAFGQNDQDFNANFETANIAENTPAVNAIPTFDASVGLILPF
jgi:hypothetical protein